jgi:hypothetical protein
MINVVMIFVLLIFGIITAQPLIKSDICSDVGKRSYIENELSTLRELLINEMKNIKSDMLSLSQG